MYILLFFCCICITIFGEIKLCETGHTTSMCIAKMNITLRGISEDNMVKNIPERLGESQNHMRQ